MSQSTLASALKTYSVLPDNRSPLERALELTLSKHLYAVPHQYPTLLNANKTSSHALPYLAAERQVTDWSPDDSETEKRLTTANQWQVFKASGTLAGISLALEGLEGESEIKKWHEYGGEPYHMQIRVWITAAPSSEMVSRLTTRITEAKSERDQFVLGLGVKAPGRLYIGGAVQLAPRLIIGPWVPPVIQAQGKTQTGGAIVSAFKVTVK